jgi:hypothetical protein
MNLAGTNDANWGIGEGQEGDIYRHVVVYRCHEHIALSAGESKDEICYRVVKLSYHKD